MYGDISAKAANKLAQPEVIYFIVHYNPINCSSSYPDMNF